MCLSMIANHRAVPLLRATTPAIAAPRHAPDTAGGIIIPDSAKEKPQEGEVVSVGTGARNEAGEIHPLEVKAGDKILFGKWSGTEVKIGGEDHVILKEEDLFGVVG